MMKQVLDIILDTFQCDRAWLIHLAILKQHRGVFQTEVTRSPYKPVYLPELAMPLDAELAALSGSLKKLENLSSPR